MAASRPETRPPPRLTLVTPAIADPATIAEGLRGALAAADIAAVLLRLAPDSENTLVKRIKALARDVQDKSAALVLHGHADLVARGGADGAHVSGIEDFREALSALKPDYIAGAGGLATRHDAMTAAESGADYVMFGEPDAHGHRAGFEAIIERVRWWAEVFEPPCVGFAASLDEVAPLAQAGADFVALGDFVWSDAQGPAAAVRAAAERLSAAEVGA